MFVGASIMVDVEKSNNETELLGERTTNGTTERTLNCRSFSSLHIAILKGIGLVSSSKI